MPHVYYLNQGLKIVGIGDHTASFYNENGIDIKAALDFASKNKNTLKGFTGATEIPSNQLLISKCDVLVPAALQNVITEENAPKIQAKLMTWKAQTDQLVRKLTLF